MNCASQCKFFGPHMGVLYGKYDLLDRLRAYKVRPAPDNPPGKYETGTQKLEGIAGTLAAVNYLAQIGEQYGKDHADRFPGFSGRRLRLKTGMTVLREYDHVLSAAILDELERLTGVHIHGITDRRGWASRWVAGQRWPWLASNPMYPVRSCWKTQHRWYWRPCAGRAIRTGTRGSWRGSRGSRACPVRS